MRIPVILLLLLLAGAAAAQTVTQAEYFIDTDPGVGNGVPVALNHVSSSGADSAWTSVRVPAGELSYGLHRLFTRYRSSEDYWTKAEAKYYFIFTPWFSNYSEHVITHIEFQFDTLAPILRDVADAGTVSLSELVTTAGLGYGLHSFYTRCRDDRGVWSGREGRYLYVVSRPPAPFVSNHLAGGEYFVNVDPGVGNGIPFGPTDGGWDEGGETSTFHLTGIPLGNHLVGLRFRDAAGSWSPVVQDTFSIGPILTVHVSGSDIILDWIPSADGAPYHIYRADQYAGPYTAVDSTGSLTWTDVNATALAPRRYYHIRQTLPGTISRDFRLPPGSDWKPLRH